MNQPWVAEIIKKFLDGTCSDEEFAYLQHWYESFDNKPGPVMTKEEKTISGREIMMRIRKNNPELNREQPIALRKGNKSIRWRKYAAAAAIIVLLAGTVLFYQKEPVSVESTHLAVIKTPVRVENQSNRIHQLVLPDSSIVWLSPKSKIEYPDKFINGERRVRLWGKAFFDIAKDPSHPFLVMSAGLVTNVLGTSFLLSAYQNSPVEVTVMTGKVEVHPENNEKDKVTLNKNQRAVLEADGNLIKLADINRDKPILWDKANLYFDNMPLPEVIAELDKKFGVHIYCKDKSIASYQLNADFTNQNLTTVLELLEKSLDVNYEMENDTVINLYANKY